MPPPKKFLAFRSSEIDSDAIWVVKIVHLLFYDKELQLAKITC